MKKLFEGFALAVSMLSIIPFFKVHDFYKGINGYAVMFYPLVGFFLGLILYAVSLVITPFFSPFHEGIIIFSLWVLLTGALHLDGLSDTIDGLFVDKKRALEVMKDPHNGGMGMVFSVVFLLLKASCVAAMEGTLYFLPLVLLLSRLNTVFQIYFYPYISKNGMGSLAKEELTSKELLIALSYSSLLIVLFGSYTLVLGALFVMFVTKSIFLKRYGGFTGDIYGFSIEITELLLLHIIIAGYM